jgi:hypothetical protein
MSVAIFPFIIHSQQGSSLCYYRGDSLDYLKDFPMIVSKFWKQEAVAQSGIRNGCSQLHFNAKYILLRKVS